MTGIALIGAGGVARRHVEMLARVGGVRVLTVTDPVPAAAERLAGECDADAVDSLEAALDRPGVDAAYVCVPPFAHGEPERAVLDRGLPMFVEKPVATDAETALDLADRVRRAGVVTGTGYHWRCLDFLDTVRDELTESPPVLAAGHWLDKRPPVAWWAQSALSGGQVIEQLTHVLDLARLLLGEAEEVYAAGARRADPMGQPGQADSAARNERGDVDDATAATVRFASGVVATLTATSLLAIKHRASLQLFGPGLMLEVTESMLSVDRGAGAVLTQAGTDPRLVVDTDFVEAVRGEREDTRAPYAEALRSHLLGVAVAESVRTRRPVRVPTGSAADEAGSTADPVIVVP